jgi:ribonuclease HII
MRRRSHAVPRASSPSLHVGIDENGLGPRLGPLIVTAVVARTTSSGAAVAKSPASRVLKARLDDSKKLVSYKDSALGEAWARAIAARTAGSPTELRSPDDLVHALSVDGRAALSLPCPADHRNQCWATEGEEFLADPRLVRTVSRDLERLATKGVEVTAAHVAIVCTSRLNESASRGLSRFLVDLHTMERLVVLARERHGGELDVTCGKVGGYNSYPSAFGPLSGRLFATLEEGRVRSAYRLPSIGTLAFVRDADASHLLVALASLVGKWVRDLLTRRVTRYHRAHDPSLPDASGYHDPVTRAFVEASALSRRTRGHPERCFERTAVREETA